MSYGTGQAKTPSKDCCGTVEEIKTKEPGCLCYFMEQALNGSAEIKSMGIHSECLLLLPSACKLTNAGLSDCPSSGGVCLISTSWKEAQHPSFLNLIHSFLAATSFRVNLVPIAPDFIFNSGGLSVAFMFVTNWECTHTLPIFNRVLKLKEQFAHFYVVATLPTKEQNESFVRSYIKYAMQFGKPVFVPVQDLEMGFIKIVNIAHALGGNALLYTTPNTKRPLDNAYKDWERAVRTMDEFLKVVTSIPGIDNHDANSLNQAIGSIEAIAKASKESILESTDLSADKAETITRFFRDPKLYCTPKIL